MRSKLHIAICGAGIGGLTVAAIISQANNPNVTVDVYEMKDKVRTIGSGIAVWKRTWQVFQELGFEQDCAERGVPLPKDTESRGPMFRKADDAHGGTNFLSQKLPYGPMTIPRPALLDILVSKLNPLTFKVHTSKKVVSYTEEPDSKLTTLHFADGSTSTADVLIGGDGVNSAIRGRMYAGDRHAIARWSGQVAYRVQCSKSEIEEKYPEHQALLDPMIWCGKDRHIVTFCGRDTFAFTCFNSTPGGEGTIYDGASVESVEPSEVTELFKDWEPEILDLLKLITEKPSRWAIQVVSDLPHFVKGRVALVGDAAHAMLPHQGIGGGQSAEDAFVLGKLLSHPITTRENVEEVLGIYERLRMPLAQEAARKSRENGLMYDFVHPEFAGGVDLKRLAEKIDRSFIWLAKGGCTEEWEKAEALLVKLS